MLKKILMLTIATSFFFPFSFIYAQFGKNKVQYQEFSWKYIQTSHFDIYFHSNNKLLANFTAHIAEQALESIQKALKFRVSRRIPIIVYNSHNQFQQTNVINTYLPEGIGGVTELFKNRVVLPFEGDYAQFKHVIHHELVHAVLNDMFYGGTIQSALSRGNLIEIPLWMNEGLSEWESIGGLDINTDVYIRDMVLNESLPDLDRLDGYNAYRGGQVFWWFVAERYGTYKIPELMTKLKSTGSVENAFKSTFNMKLEDFSEEWKKYLKKYYFADIEKFSEPSEFAVRLTNHTKEENFYNTSPAISPQGNKIAYIADFDGLFSLFIMDLDNHNKKEKVVSSFRQQDFEELNVLTPGITWSGDGEKLAISAKYKGEDIIYIVDTKTSDYERIPLGFKQISSVAWATKSNVIAFSATVLDRKDIYLYNLDSKTITRLTNDIFYDDHPIWSPNEDKLYFISGRVDEIKQSDSTRIIPPWKIETGKRDIYEYNLQTKKIRRITFTPDYNKTSLAISGDSKMLYFVSDKNGIGNIYRLNLETGRIDAITNSLSNITQISLSKSGNELVFSALSNGGFDIYMIKNPNSRIINSDSLPLTKFRIIEKERTISKHKVELDTVAYNTTPDSVGITYGNFSVDFSRQNMIKPNKDILSNNLQDSYSISPDSEFVDYDYKVKFSPDIILGNPSYSSFWGYQGVAQMLFSDVLGDHQIYVQANLWFDLKNSNFLVQYAYLANIIDYNFYAYQSSLLLYGYNPFASEYNLYRLRNYGLGMSASYPLSIFNRFELNLSLFNVTRENTSDITEPSSERTIIYPEFRYVYDDVLYGSFAPVRGSRYFLEFKSVPKIFKNSINFFTFKFDYRRYWDFGYFLKFAFRATGAKSFGSNPQRFFLGGTDNWINYEINNNSYLFQNPEEFAFLELITPLRGWAFAEVVGTQYFTTNLELRFPLFTALLPGPIPIIFNDILGVIFFDMGGAWSGNFTDFKATKTNEKGETIPNALLMSVGIGARAWILGLPFKLDIAWRNEFKNWSKPYYIFSINYDF